MDNNSENLRTAVVTRRGQLGMNQEQASRRGGVPLGTWESIEQGRSRRPRASTLAGIDRALAWPPGTAYAVLNAVDPPPASVMFSDGA